MGQCQSQPEVQVRVGSQEDDTRGTLVKTVTTTRNDAGWLQHAKDRVKTTTRKLTIITTGKDVDIQPPSTARTVAETPSPLDVSHDSSEGSSLAPVEEHDDDDELIHHHHSSKSSSISLVNFFPSLRHTEHLDAIIPEEVDPDAPSDEEDERVQRQQEAAARKLAASIPSSKRGRGPVSPPRPQDHIIMKHKKTVSPSSVVHHMPSVAPSPNSVNPHTISQFHKLRVQVKLAARQERKKRRAAKLEDRYEDVKGYNTLWENFQDIQGNVETTTQEPRKLKRSNSFDLHDTNTWFFDFQSFDEEDTVDDDDNMSQSSLSLHSTTSMESQRRYFQEKSERRAARTQKSEPNFVLLQEIMAAKSPPKEDDSPATRPVTPKRKSPTSLQQLLSTPPNIFRRNKDDTPSDLGTPSTPGRVAPTLNAFQIATGEPDYYVHKGRTEQPLADDQDTPKASSRNKSRQAVETTRELDMNNDYQVARRRRVPSNQLDEAGVKLVAEERKDAETLGIRLPPSPKREFDYSSSAIDVSMTDRPEIKVMRMSPKDESTRNATIREKVVNGNAAQCLEQVNADLDSFAAELASVKKRLLETKRDMDARFRTDEPMEPSIQTMSTEQFLRVSDNHALVQVSRNFGHSVREESFESRGSPTKARGYDSDWEAPPPIADLVTREVDDMVAKYSETVPDDEGAADVSALSESPPRVLKLSVSADKEESYTRYADIVTNEVDEILAAYRNETEDNGMMLGNGPA